jgi:DNA polymerase-1
MNRFPESLTAFHRVWLVDFEYRQPDGARPKPLCLVATEWRTGETLRIWLDAAAPRPPIQFGEGDLLVAYYASAEIGCFLALNWPLPVHVLDLYAEFRWLTSGREAHAGYGLLGALAYFGIVGMDSCEKDGMRKLAQQETHTPQERAALLDYCESDVAGLRKLLSTMQQRVDLPRALLRGRYMVAAAKIEANGIPLDIKRLDTIQRHWQDITDTLISEVDRDFGVYEKERFKAVRWSAWCRSHAIAWPILESGRPKLDDETFNEMAQMFPVVRPVKELRATLGRLRLRELPVGPDGRNRYMLSAFASLTGRNQPSTSKCIFGPATWVRSLIQPKEGVALAYIDYEQQEFGIAAALSDDAAMQEAYRSGDPYLAFAKQAGAVPADATKRTHTAERERFKIWALAVQYGMGSRSLGFNLGLSDAHGRELIEHHRRTYRRYWEWSDRIEARGMLGVPLRAAFGWQTVEGRQANPRSLRNFPSQANGAEMLRIACIALTEAGIRVCAPVHDAVLIEDSEDRIEEAVQRARDIMRKASEVVLNGFEIRTEAKLVRYPDRYSDLRGASMWGLICRLTDPFMPPNGGEGSATNAGHFDRPHPSF